MKAALFAILISTLTLHLACQARAGQLSSDGAPKGAGAPDPASAPAVANARLESQAPAASLEAALRQAAARGSDPLWVGYSVPMVTGMGNVCCHSFDKVVRKEKVCRLEGKSNGWSSDRDRPRAEQALTVLLRFENGRLSQLRGYSADCPLDAGDRRFVWLGSVEPEHSVAYLAGQARAGGEHRHSEDALPVLALHRDPKADAALEALAAPGTRAKLREEALFWLGQTRGERGARFLAGVIRDDRDDKVREHAIFCLSQSSVAWQTEAIIRLAQEDRSPHLRGQALFWLAQTGGAAAPPAILAAIEKDADSEVRKEAVFALSQLQDGEAVPALLQVAREGREPAIRKEAIFWLAQSKDPAALAYLDKVLND